MPDLDQAIHVETLKLNGEKNNECIIFVTTNTYGIEINNPEVKLVI